MTPALSLSYSEISVSSRVFLINGNFSNNIPWQSDSLLSQITDDLASLCTANSLFMSPSRDKGAYCTPRSKPISVNKIEPNYFDPISIRLMLSISDIFCSLDFI